MLERNYLNYRLALAELVIKILGPPCVLAELALRVAPVSAGWILRLFLLYPAATTGYWTLRNAYTDWRNAREAARRGAVLPPKISGKWPGSLDLALELERETSTGYAAYEFRRFFEEIGSNTVTIRMLWQDIVREKAPHRRSELWSDMCLAGSHAGRGPHPTCRDQRFPTLD